MDEKERFELLVAPEIGDGVYTHVKKMEDSNPLDFDLEIKEIPHLESGIELLNNGLCDLLAVSANWWYENRTNNLSASIVMPRREPTCVLVSEDKPEYLPSKGIVIACKEIARRQMIRARPDVSVQLPHEYGKCPSTDIEMVNWLENLRTEGKIDGYIIPRPLYSTISHRTRRHTLGLQRDNPVRFRFVPLPLEGYTVLLSRTDFPTHKFAPIIDQGAALSMRLEIMMLDSIPEEMHDRVAIFVEQRKVSTVLTEAEKAGDELARKGMINPLTGEIDGPTRIHAIIELLNKSGTTTASVERVFPPEESHSAILTVINNWNSLLQIMQEETIDGEKRGRMKELMDTYLAELIESGSFNEENIGSPMMSDF